jgi:hypothetical protein
MDTAILEEGYQVTVQGGGVAATYPVGFQRFGVLSNLEVDLIGPNQNRASGGPTVQNGLSDLGAGFKYALSAHGPVHWAIDGLFTAATGSQAFTNGGPTAQLNLDASYSLTSNIGLGATLGFASSSGPLQSAANSFGRYGAVVPSFVVTYTPSRSSQLYAEYAARTKIGPNMGGDSVIDYGVQQLLGSNVEIDAEYGTDLTPIGGSRFHYLGVGLGLFLK